MKLQRQHIQVEAQLEIISPVLQPTSVLMFSLCFRRNRNDKIAISYFGKASSNLNSRKARFSSTLRLSSSVQNLTILCVYPNIRTYQNIMIMISQSTKPQFIESVEKSVFLSFYLKKIY